MKILGYIINNERADTTKIQCIEAPRILSIYYITNALMASKNSG